MKKFSSIILAAILTLVLSNMLFAQQLTYTITDPNEVPIFEWDSNNDDTVDGYRLYQSTTSNSYQFGSEHCVVATGKDCLSTNIGTLPEQTLYFVVTAFRQNNESEPSNEIKLIVDYTIPLSPDNLRFSKSKIFITGVGGRWKN